MTKISSAESPKGIAKSISDAHSVLKKSKSTNELGTYSVTSSPLRTTSSGTHSQPSTPTCQQIRMKSKTSVKKTKRVKFELESPAQPEQIEEENDDDKLIGNEQQNSKQNLLFILDKDANNSLNGSSDSNAAKFFCFNCTNLPHTLLRWSFILIVTILTIALSSLSNLRLIFTNWNGKQITKFNRFFLFFKISGICLLNLIILFIDFISVILYLGRNSPKRLFSSCSDSIARVFFIKVIAPLFVLSINILNFVIFLHLIITGIKQQLISDLLEGTIEDSVIVKLTCCIFYSLASHISLLAIRKVELSDSGK